MTEICPCCGQQVAGRAEALIATIKLPKLQDRLARAMLADFGHWVRWPKLLDAAYGDDPDGGPLTAQRTMAVHIFRLRHAIEPLGLMIENYPGVGYRIRWSAPAITLKRRAA